MKTVYIKNILISFFLFVCIGLQAQNSFSVNNMVFSLVSTTAVAIENIEVPPDGNVVLPTEITYNNRTFKVSELGGTSGTFKNPEQLVSIVIPSSIKYFSKSYSSAGSAAYQFSGCINLKKVVIEDSDDALGIPANTTNSDIREPQFVDCPLEEVYIGRNILYGYNDTGTDSNSPISKNFGSPFKRKKTLKKVEFSDKVSKIYPGLFYECEQLKEIIIPPKVVEIPTCAFYGCSSLSQIVLPDSLRSIGHYAFYGSQLKSIILPDSVERMREGSFMDCRELTSVTINDRLSYIGVETFMNCEKLSKVVIGKSVERIAYRAFKGISIQQIESKILEPNKCQIDDEVFDLSTYTFATLYVPQGTKEKYENNLSWSQFYSIEEMQTTKMANINSDSTNSEVYFNINGYKTSRPHKGINIKVMSDGTSKKVFVK